MYFKLLTKILVILSLLVITGCDDDQPSMPLPHPTPKKSVIPPKIQVPETPSEGEEGAAPSSYRYDSLGRRDPFEPLTAIKRPLALIEGKLTPLQKYELAQFRLIGIITGKNEPMAMVIAPDGKSFILKNETKIGRNNGKVVDITSDSVFVEEKYYDFSGEIRKNVQRLELPKQGGIE